MSTVQVSLTVNGERHELDVEPRLLLVHLLRDRLGLTGTHVGCDTSNCGACTVHLDGDAVKSCTVYHNFVRAVKDAAKTVRTGAVETPGVSEQGRENIQAIAETGLGA